MELTINIQKLTLANGISFAVHLEDSQVKDLTIMFAALRHSVIRQVYLKSKVVTIEFFKDEQKNTKSRITENQLSYLVNDEILDYWLEFCLVYLRDGTAHGYEPYWSTNAVGEEPDEGVKKLVKHNVSIIWNLPDNQNDETSL